MFLRHEMHTAPAGLLAEPGKYGMMRQKTLDAATLVRTLRVWRKK